MDQPAPREKPELSPEEVVVRQAAHQAKRVAMAETRTYIARRMAAALPCANRRVHLTEALKHVAIEDGLFLEFGVAYGRSINLIASVVTPRKVYGFDSFEGLPEDWAAGVGKGAFAQEKLPEVAENVELVVGWFDNTLPPFLAAHPGPLALLHVDCDLYSSTRTVLTLCTSRIIKGTVIAFDEYFGYAGWREHEFKAFQQFCRANNRTYEYLTMVPTRFQASVVMTN